jgi:hypothetical protein
MDSIDFPDDKNGGETPSQKILQILFNPENPRSAHHNQPQYFCTSS